MEKDTQQQKQPVGEPNTSTLVTDDTIVLQSNLFTDASTVIAEPADPLETPFPPIIRTHPLTDQSSLAACAIPYQQELLLRGKSNYTVTCFLSDLKMFSGFMGKDTPVGRITKEQLTDWLMKLKFGNKGQAPAPKTMARRVTFLRNFFSWLAREGIIREDPSASLVLERPLPPLPELLFEDEIQRLLEAASAEPSLPLLALSRPLCGLEEGRGNGPETEPHRSFISWCARDNHTLCSINWETAPRKATCPSNRILHYLKGISG